MTYVWQDFVKEFGGFMSDGPFKIILSILREDSRVKASRIVEEVELFSADTEEEAKEEFDSMIEELGIVESEESEETEDA